MVRWHHLSVLVEFAMQLRATLNNINAESFNHFILQMGKLPGSQPALNPSSVFPLSFDRWVSFHEPRLTPRPRLPSPV